MSAELQQLHRSLRVAQLRPEAANYVRGNCYLESFRAAGGSLNSAAVAFSKNALATEVANAVAGDYRIDAKTVKNDATFALQVRTIAKNCGNNALRAMLASESRLKMKEIGSISRMAAPRQRYEIDQAAPRKADREETKDGHPSV